MIKERLQTYLWFFEVLWLQYFYDLCVNEAKLKGMGEKWFGNV